MTSHEPNAAGPMPSDNEDSARTDGHRPSRSVADRLPPPAFPPGQRRDWVHRPRHGSGESPETPTEGSIPDDALYAPDEPIRRIDDPSGGSGGEGSRDPLLPLTDTGDRLSDEDVATLLMDLAAEIRDHQAGRFLWKAYVTPFEGAVRGLVSGYLRLGRREGERA